MGVFDDMVEDVAGDIIELLLKTLLSGTVLVSSTPAIALASAFNSRVGFVDPLLLPPRQTFRDYPYSMFVFDATVVRTGTDGWPSYNDGLLTGSKRWLDDTRGLVSSGTDAYA